MDEGFQARLEARVARLQADTGLTGVAAAVMTNGQLAGAAASGERRRGSGIPVNVDDRWHVGSITKSMTATLLAVLEDDGRLSLHDTLPALLPDVEMASGWSVCTLHHLLIHTAGARANFPNRVQSVWPETPEELVAARRRFIAAVLATEPKSPCGERFAYSNVGYTIAGHVAETIAGKPYESLLQVRPRRSGRPRQGKLTPWRHCAARVRRARDPAGGGRRRDPRRRVQRPARPDRAPVAPDGIVHLLETAGGPVRVEPAGRSSVFPLLPPADAAWVTETGADVIVPVPGPGTDVLGVLVVGRRLDGRLVRSVDLPFLDALGAAAGLALARLQLLNAPGAGSWEAPPAAECPVCRCVTAAGAPPGCACGSAYVATEVPTLLAGKFRLTRRLGAGGMGAVYLARDLRLERDVAIKILTARSLDRLMGLHSEAWAMSTVTHPAVAQIHGVEVWRGRPCLVVEFLAGGTLEDRLRDGPLAPAQAVSVVARLADALAALHEKDCLHGDVKPSNIGFTAEGAPKLLDFGLAHAVDDAALVGGTLPYLSPEVLTGRPAEAADDVWSLCVVLYEMVTGRQPFAGGTLEEVQRRIRRQRLAAGGPDAAAAPTAATAVAVFAASILTAPRAGRPDTAPAFAAALAEVPRTA